MAPSQTAQLAFSSALFGVLSFILGIFAELKKPPYGTPIQGKDVIICKFPSDPTVALGALSVVAVFISAALGILSVFFPYKGKSVPRKVMFQNTTLFVFFQLAVGLTLLGAGMMLTGTIQEALQHIHNVHQDLEYACPTAKTGVFGGAAFLNLDASIFWLINLMLTMNVREDYFGETEDSKGEYREVLTGDNDMEEDKHTAA
ncbi:uncharacterized protein LOC103702838 [Phoenix dactylifera]|uniref:Uncharacterized protein LOC103702838 n=1 Tax=Phoenix dactylifera TaxID=42345 RepID=A0A8B9A2U0_PHODC|nr:uncharacterized protein LOC103702838 [Phoenix dactylifera]XP_038980926.1 uncharacterized protein LOC103702838 [Phoenix dactylifera]